MVRPKVEPELAQVHPKAAGIDIGGSEHWVSIPAELDPEPVRKFSCFTADLYAIAEWLKSRGITTVAMESTGVYWIPPDDQVCVFRSYIRQRDRLTKSASVHIQRMQKALTEMNVQLHRVVSDVTGVTGMAIIRAILSGERDPQRLAALKDPRAKRSIAEIAAALVGDYREEHLFVLKQELSLYDTYQQQIQQCDLQIEQCLSQFDSQSDEPLPPRPKGKKPSRNAPNFDLRSHLYRISGIDFTQIDGLEGVK